MSNSVDGNINRQIRPHYHAKNTTTDIKEKGN